jgi:Spy/CpxP family protein refolding chaperone
MRPVSTKIVLWTTLASLAIVLACLARPTIGQDEGKASQPAAAKTAKKSRGRLPNFYRQVVDPQQRETIYKIQAEYAPKIAELQAQLEKLIKERDEKIAAVLTPEQRKRVEDLNAAARAKRRPKKQKPPAQTPVAE